MKERLEEVWPVGVVVQPYCNVEQSYTHDAVSNFRQALKLVQVGKHIRIALRKLIIHRAQVLKLGCVSGESIEERLLVFHRMAARQFLIRLLKFFSPCKAL